MIIAHRGVHNNKEVVENSIEAFKLAKEKGYAIEFDISITKDNRLVIFHDDNLKRICGVDKNINDVTYEELKKLKLLNTDEHIPTFKELLEVVDGKVFLDIEIKTTSKRKEVVDLTLKELENYKGELSLKSFDPKIVRLLQKKTKDYKIGLLLTLNNSNKIFNFFIKKGIYLVHYDFLSIDSKMLTDEYYNKYIKKCPIQVWRVSYKDKEKYSKYKDITFIYDDLY